MSVQGIGGYSNAYYTSSYGVQPTLPNGMPIRQGLRQEPGFFDKLGAAVGGIADAPGRILSGIGDILTDPKKLAFATAATVACFIPGVNAFAIPALAAYGLFQGGKGVLEGMGNIAEGWSTGNLDQIRDGSAGATASGAGAALSAYGLRAQVRGAFDRGRLGNVVDDAGNAVKDSVTGRQHVVAGRGASMEHIQDVSQIGFANTARLLPTYFRNAWNMGRGELGAAAQGQAALNGGWGRSAGYTYPHPTPANGAPPLSFWQQATNVGDYMARGAWQGVRTIGDDIHGTVQSIRNNPKSAASTVKLAPVPPNQGLIGRWTKNAYDYSNIGVRTFQDKLGGGLRGTYYPMEGFLPGMASLALQNDPYKANYYQA